jgi:hypothetical protein
MQETDDVHPLALNAIHDLKLRVPLERCESRIRTFAQEVQGGWLSVTQECCRAKERFMTGRPEGLGYRYPYINFVTLCHTSWDIAVRFQPQGVTRA